MEDDTLPNESFFYFCEEKRPVLMDRCRNKGQKVNIGNISKELGSMWSKLADKEKYISLNKKDKVRYQEAMEAYKN